MKQSLLIKNFLRYSFLKFLFVGVINTIFGYLIFSLFVYLTSNVYVSVVLATILGVLFNFNTYGKLVFKSKDNSKIYHFFGVYLFTMAIQMLLLKMFAKMGIGNPYIAGGIITLPMAALSFFLMRKYVFTTPAVKTVEYDNAQS